MTYQQESQEASGLTMVARGQSVPDITFVNPDIIVRAAIKPSSGTIGYRIRNYLNSFWRKSKKQS